MSFPGSPPRSWVLAAWCGLLASILGLASGPRLAAQTGQESGPVVGDTVESQRARFVVEPVLDGLQQPIALTFVAEDRALLAQRTRGALWVLEMTEGQATPVTGLPAMLVEESAGVFDVRVGPRFEQDGWVYLSYAAPRAGGGATALDRVRLDGSAIVARERLFEASPVLPTGSHYGGRIAFDGDYVFLTLGDRNQPNRHLAQSLGTHNGSIVRLHLDGRVPQDNPFVGVPDALPEIWSYGHRNPQGIAVNPHSGSLWSHEHGPAGGDEVNVIRPGSNYGWPLISYGREYAGGPVGEGRTRRPGTEQPIYVYRPSIAPSDLLFPSGRGFPEWNDGVLIGALGLQHLNRLTLDGDRVIHEERLLEGRGWRIRMLQEAADGSIYLGTDSGLLVRLRPIP